MTGTHHARDTPTLRIAVLTVSDTRTSSNDESGQTIANRIEAAGHTVASRTIVADEIIPIQTTAMELVSQADALIVTGGTGMAARDVTPEALEPLFEKRMLGFGEAFRALSTQQVGPLAMLSRADAGIVRTEGGLRPVFMLPGAPRAVDLAMDQLILRVLPHMMGMTTGQHAR